MTSWTSYPHIANLGHPSLANLFSVPTYATEKVDGSQFSFGRFGDAIKIKSKGKEMPLDHPEQMFQAAAETVARLAPDLIEGWTYRAEYLQRPKHNHLAYARIPAQHLILFDIAIGPEAYLPYPEIVQEGQRLGLETVPCLAQWTGTPLLEDLQALLRTVSVLGGPPIEGFVIKPQTYTLFGKDDKPLMGKYVSEVFREESKKSWAQANPKSGDILQQLGEQFRTEARWRKAVQHLQDQGLLESDPRDIGKLLKELEQDTGREIKDVVQAELWRWAWPQIKRKVAAGFPEWYKEQLLQKQVIP